MSTADDSALKQYSEIIKNNGIKDVIKDVIVKSPEHTGDQFASQCKLVTITFVDDSIPPIELFVKLTVNNPIYASQIKDMMMFEKEVRFFNQLLPDLKDFAESHPGYDRFLDRIMPKCYFAADNLIVFENVALKGYSILDKKFPHDLDVVKQVVKNLAQLHGVLLAYIQHIGLEAFEKKYEFVASVSIRSEEAANFTGPWVDTPISGAIKILTEKPTPGSEKALEHFRKYENVGFANTVQLYKRGNQKCPDVVIHSDCWNGNIMFQRNPETQKPENSMIIDMQTVIYGTPAMDLQHYLFVGPEPKVIQSNWKKLIKVYYDDLTNIMENLGQKVTFSLEDLESDVQDKCLAGLFFSMFNAYAFDTFDDIGDMGNQEGDPSAQFIIQMKKSLDKLMEARGQVFSERIVRIFEVFQDVKAGIERPE
ncbi:unnamed protein product [Allacma fusca]|uniref:CHK kinase-like domain-containing protein n=1 Tax=Allacma fusca TaxID=39272 RepID=A0A8J2KHQ8_9HEXA|nr:unnamed protein product [Allacma fusca]